MKPNKTDFNPDEYDFFSVTVKRNGTKNVYFRKARYIEQLRYMGFMRYILDRKVYYIRVKNNVADLVEEYSLMDAFETHIKNCDADWLFDEYDIGIDFLRESFFNNLDQLTKPKLLTRLRPRGGQVEFQNDSKESAFFYYQNGFVEVTKDKIQFKPYSELDKIVFRTQILKRNYQGKFSTKGKNGNWGKFLMNIAGDAERAHSLQSILGYILHHYFEIKRKAIIFTDSRLDFEANGRSGKGLLFTAIKYMMNREEFDKEAVELSGKDFNHHDRFKYEECDINTKVIHIDDAQRGMNIENHFVDIVRGIKLQRRNKDSITIPVKMVFSTNRTIRIPSGSAADRVVEFELADHYSADYSPSDEFDEWFFRDWTAEQWAVFDNLMLECVQIYLREGIVKPSPINLLKRKLMEETAPEFVDFMEDILFAEEPIYTEFSNKLGDWLDKKELYNKFRDLHPDFTRKKFFSQRAFNSWLRLFAKYDERLQDEAHERKSNGDYLIAFWDKNMKAYEG